MAKNSEEHDVFVIASSSSMVGPSEQGIRLSYRLSRVMVESEVKMSKVKRPVSLMIVKLLCCHKVLKIPVVHPNFYW